jgi:hypothetical protein
MTRLPGRGHIHALLYSTAPLLVGIPVVIECETDHVSSRHGPQLPSQLWQRCMRIHLCGSVL